MLGELLLSTVFHNQHCFSNLPSSLVLGKKLSFTLGVRWGPDPHLKTVPLCPKSKLQLAGTWVSPDFFVTI